MDDLEIEKQVYYLLSLKDDNIDTLMEVFFASDKEVQESFICFIVGGLIALIKKYNER